MTINEFGRYTVKTIQYGEFEDVVNHADLRSLRSDLLNIAHLQTVQVLEIYEDGQAMPAARKRILLTQSRRDAAKVFKIKTNY